MLSHILGQAYEFERIHGVAPNVVYINPLHFQALYREFPGLFEPAQTIRLGFRVVIIPASRLAHPEVSRLAPRQRRRCRTLPIGPSAPVCPVSPEPGRQPPVGLPVARARAICWSDSSLLQKPMSSSVSLPPASLSSHSPTFSQAPQRCM